MSEPFKKLDESKNPGPPKKPKARTAGAPTTRQDIFNIILPEHPDEATSGNANDDPDGMKITWVEMVKEKTRRKSMDLWRFGDRKGHSNNDNSKAAAASKTA